MLAGWPYQWRGCGHSYRLRPAQRQRLYVFVPCWRRRESHTPGNWTRVLHQRQLWWRRLWVGHIRCGVQPGGGCAAVSERHRCPGGGFVAASATWRSVCQERDSKLFGRFYIPDHRGRDYTIWIFNGCSGKINSLRHCTQNINVVYII